jgi:hypothetical protein
VNVGRASVVPVEPIQSTTKSRDFDRPLKISMASRAAKQHSASVVPVEPHQSTTKSRDFDRPLKISMVSGAAKQHSRPVYEEQEIVEPRQGVVKKESTNVAIKQRQG